MFGERKIGHAEERLKVLIDDFYLVREDISSWWRDQELRLTGHPAFMDKPKHNVNVCCIAHRRTGVKSHVATVTYVMQTFANSATAVGYTERPTVYSSHNRIPHQ